ncbi:hypothetical protein MOO46_02980 [Apilactobacillus apisilvae]|uniref:Uncharacterized protein n=1 Tax=Apilactobacillus apisilvae TaxID=2923364 RepID=A0ABY4PJ16_9LACO|nr:hypothetical protein [Apilactobacillus apisilvae]UQS85562.1 hypothetical protein MOO46_02980 [Apilactobacillus apisilvae]
MDKNIKITFGNNYIINLIKKKHPSRKIYIFKSINNVNQNYQIVDFSNKRSIFKNKLEYRIIYSNSINDNKEMVNYLYFNLDEENTKILKANMINIKYKNVNSIYMLKEDFGKKRDILMTCWKSYKDFYHWFHNNPVVKISDLSMTYKKDRCL